MLWNLSWEASEGRLTPVGTVFCTASPAWGKGRTMKRWLLSSQLVWALIDVRPKKLDLTIYWSWCF